MVASDVSIHTDTHTFAYTLVLGTVKNGTISALLLNLSVAAHISNKEELAGR